MKNYFIIHGSFSSPFSNWFPWLFEEIEKTKDYSKEEPICYVPQMPTGLGFQNYENWEKVIKIYINSGLISENTTIFAHSIAPAFVCKFLVNNKIKVDKLVFVCGFNNYFGVSPDYDEVNKTMYLENLHEVKNYANEIVCLYSDNDPYVAFEAEKEFADTVATKQVLIKNGGHLNTDAGFKEFANLKNYI